MLSNIASASLIGLSCLSAIVSAAPAKFPLSNNFPNITNPSSQLTAIEDAAHGSLSNGSPPPKIMPDSLTSLQLIAFNELSEVAFFTELLVNITSNVPGFQIKDNKTRDVIIKTLTAVQAQEELHELNANGAATKFGGEAIQPCEYNFPVTNIDEAFELAATFTDVVMGTLQNVETIFGSDGDIGLIQGVASVIGQEGEQNGYYRTLLGKIPSALPFLTTSTREFAFSALNQMFVVPGSCPNSNIINLPVFAPLSVDSTNIQPKVQDLSFSFQADVTITPQLASTNSNYSLSLVYINQQNLPVVETLDNIKVNGNTVSFTAKFPFDEATFGNGLTIAAVTNSTGPFTNAAAVADVTVFGPGLIEIN